MIPVRLSMRNFMCYRDNVPPLSFEGIHLACLCGDNGHGKSALIDAITWALWGRSRARSDDDLIHLGRSTMEVEFDFEAGGGLYRVIRKRTKARSKAGRGKTPYPGQTLLEFQVVTEGGSRSISGDSIAQTQQRIVDTLHMDYSTFVNSAFLRQGHADEFTVKPPGERKKVLADIMGLSLYDELGEKARSRVREREQQQGVFQSAIEEMQPEIGRKKGYQDALEEVRGVLAELDNSVEEQGSQVAVLRERIKALHFKQEQLTELKKAMEQATGELSRWQSRLVEHEHESGEYEKLLEQRLSIEAGYNQLQDLKKEAEELNLKLERSFSLTQRRDQLVRVVNEAKGSKLEERGRRHSKVDGLKTRAQKIAALEKEWGAARARYGQVAMMQKELEDNKQQAQELALRIQYLKSARSQLEQEVGELRDKLALLRQGEATCPLCETELGAQGKQRIEDKYEAEISAKFDAQRQNEAEIAERTVRQRELSLRINELGLKASQEGALGQRQMAALEKEISLCRQAKVELAPAMAGLEEIEELLAKSEFAQAEQRELEEIRQQIAGLGYDAKRHQQVRGLLGKLEKYEGWQRKLEEAESRLPSEKTALSEAREAVSMWAGALESHKEKETILTGDIKILPGLVSELRRIEQEYDSLRQRQTAIRDRMVALKERVARCSELENIKREKERTLLGVLREKEIYEELAQAFGKRGLQAFLIEAIIPEIEEEADRLLGRMTDNRMHVSIETQRETRKGETIETLDIKVSDELGVRNYEMYSGGEAFRINLALRIALSRVLARRAGAPLPILFIDEGFGTQDSSGLGKLIGAINSIQDDFKKIVVITHLEELRDAFPVRIEVTKTGEGAMISLS